MGTNGVLFDSFEPVMLGVLGSLGVDAVLQRIYELRLLDAESCLIRRLPRLSAAQCSQALKLLRTFHVQEPGCISDLTSDSWGRRLDAYCVNALISAFTPPTSHTRQQSSFAIDPCQPGPVTVQIIEFF